MRAIDISFVLSALAVAAACGAGDAFQSGDGDSGLAAGAAGSAGSSAGTGAGAGAGPGGAGGGMEDAGGSSGSTPDGSDDAITFQDGPPPPDGAADVISTDAIGSDGVSMDTGVIDAPTCYDLDDDGVTDCDGDCDDLDPTAQPGLSEICGDLVDNDCKNGPDDVCQGLGTYVSEKTGDPANPGTRDLPVKTIGHGISNASVIGFGVDVYVANGVYNESFSMVNDASVFGGHECAAQPCSWVRDPVAYVSKVNTTDAQGVYFGSGVGRATILDGFTISARAGTANGTRFGWSAIRMEGSGGTVRGNVITSGAVSGGNWFDGVSSGIAILGSSTDPDGPLITGNNITGGPAWGSNGILLDSGNFPEPSPTRSTITNNTISGGVATHSRGIAAWQSAQGSVADGNDIRPGPSSSGASIGIEVASRLDIVGNRINVRGPTGTCASTPDWCGGIRSASGTSLIANNVVYGYPGTQSAGLMITEAEMAAGALEINGNTFFGGASSSAGTPIGRAAAIQMRPGAGITVFIGKIRNNILIATGSPEVHGVFEEGNPSNFTRVIHPELFQYNAIWIGANINSSSSLYRFRTTTSVQLFTTILQVDAEPTINPLLNIHANCALDPTLHLTPPSPCVDLADPVIFTPYDFEGDARPIGMGVDIGHDESM